MEDGRRDGGHAAFSLLGAPARSGSAIDERDYASDLHLDQIVSGITRDRDDAAALEALYFARTRDVDAVHYRHAVFRDLDGSAVWSAVGEFSASARNVISHLSQARAMRVLQQRRGWVLDAAMVYCAAIRRLASDLEGLSLESEGMQGFQRYLVAYAGSAEFDQLEADAGACRASLESVQYCVNVDGGRVTVTRYAEEPDYSEEIRSVFERFRQGAVRSYLAEYRVWPGMTRVGEQILGLVVRLFPEEFSLLANFCDRHASFLDAGVHRFYRELQFYVAYREYIDPVVAAGLRFCYPEVNTRSKVETAEETFDLSLAKMLVSEGGKVVSNDFRLDSGEQIFLVSGPNQGGKTTFARTFGQLHHLAAIGCPVPGARARLFLCDHIFTHFNREEDSTLLAGKLESDLLEMQRTLRTATPASIVVMNEVFSSTSLEDARFLGAEAVRKLIELGCLAVFVSFIDELASISTSVVSMVSTIVPGDPSQRTFKVVRGPADGLAFALAIAEKYRLTYPQLVERIP